jgi:hypothetical protein
MSAKTRAELHLAGDSVITELTPSRDIGGVSEYPTLFLLQSPGNIFPPEPCYNLQHIHRQNHPFAFCLSKYLGNGFTLSLSVGVSGPSS